jgi:uncharacterized protein (TIGR00645 family)
MSTAKDTLESVEYKLESTIFNSRWLLAPFYLGLVLCIVLLLVKFLQELLHLSTSIYILSEAEAIIGILTLVDMSLVASLLLMIIFSGYEIFVSKIDVANHKDRPDWMGKVDFTGLKLKVIGAIVAISAIELLKTFVQIPDAPTESDTTVLKWKVIIHMTFVVSGVLFALMDRISTNQH